MAALTAFSAHIFHTKNAATKSLITPRKVSNPFFTSSPKVSPTQLLTPLTSLYPASMTFIANVPKNPTTLIKPSANTAATFKIGSNFGR